MMVSRLVILLCGVLMVCGGLHAAEARVGKKLPGFDISKVIYGSKLKKGRATVIDFWEPDEDIDEVDSDEFAPLRALHALKEEFGELINVMCITEASDEDATRFVSLYRDDFLNFTLVDDNRKHTLKRWCGKDRGSRYIARNTAFVIDPDGIIVKRVNIHEEDYYRTSRLYKKPLQETLHKLLGPAVGAERLEEGSKVPGFDLSMMQGDEPTSPYALIVTFFDPRSPRDRKAVGFYNGLAEAHKKLSVLGISTSSREKTRIFIDGTDPAYPIGVDEHGNTAIAWLTERKAPLTFLVIKNKVHWIGQPEDGLHRVVKEALKGKRGGGGGTTSDSTGGGEQDGASGADGNAAAGGGEVDSRVDQLLGLD
jgi:peroxiredoxin